MAAAAEEMAAAAEEMAAAAEETAAAAARTATAVAAAFAPISSGILLPCSRSKSQIYAGARTCVEGERGVGGVLDRLPGAEEVAEHGGEHRPTTRRAHDAVEERAVARLLHREARGADPRAAVPRGLARAAALGRRDHDGVDHAVTVEEGGARIPGFWIGPDAKQRAAGQVGRQCLDSENRDWALLGDARREQGIHDSSRI